MPSPVSVLVITAAPDSRRSTGALLDHVEDLRRRGLRVELWFLRDHGRDVPFGARVIDSLRTWDVPVRLERLGIPFVGDRLRGARLRRWYRAAAPDVVLLDDGLGSRVLPRGATPIRILRCNAEPPADLFEEGPATAVAHLVLAAADVEAPTIPGAAFLEATAVRDLRSARAAGSATERRRVRELLGLPTTGPLVAGWGPDGWIDGPDLFVRALWHLEHREGVVAHGVWFGLDPTDPDEDRRLRDEAARCGVSDRLHLRAAPTTAARACGDAVLLPGRAAPDLLHVLDALASGAQVVTFHSIGLDDPALHTVAPLDLDAAATAVAAALTDDRAAALDHARSRLSPLDVSSWDDRFLAALHELP